MATAHSKSAARIMIAPAVFVLLVWMLIPLLMTLYFSFADYRPLRGTFDAWIGFDNYVRFLTSSSFMSALITTLWMVAGILSITIIGGVLLALLLDQPMYGQGFVRILVIAPFFVMPTVSALVWKNMFFNVDNGLFSYLFKGLGFQPYDFLSQSPLLSIIVIVAWQWLPFATLILLTAGFVAVPLHHPASPEPGHHRRHPDPDDLPVVDFRRDLRDHERGLRDAHIDLSRLPARAGEPERRPGVRRRDHCRHSCQCDRNLPDADRRQEPR